MHWAVLGYNGLYWAVIDYIGLFWTVWELYWEILGYTVRTILGFSWLYWAPLDRIGPELYWTVLG